MKRFYFDIREGDEIIPDEEGLELSTIEKVQEEGGSLAGGYGPGCHPRAGGTNAP